jgi:cytochrome P450
MLVGMPDHLGGERPRSYPFGANVAMDLHPSYREVRENEPLSRVQLPYGEAGWLVTRYDDVKLVLSDPRFSRAEATRRDQPRVTPEILPLGLLDMDPPDHARIRRLFAQAFTSRQSEGLRPRVEQITTGLIEAMAEAGPPVDLMAAFARPLPMRVIFELFGVPYGDREAFARNVDNAISAEASESERNEGLRSQGEYMTGLIAQRRREPADDLLGRLILARDEGDRLSEEELVFLSFSVLAAGYETTTSQIGNFTYLLLTRPGQYALLHDRQDLLPGAVEELLRFAPLVASAAIVRYAMEDVTLSGGTVAAGEAVLTFAPAANRDPAVYRDPEVLDLTRPATVSHLSFGHGAHHCVGAQLARMELQVALGALTSRLPGLHLAVSPDEVPWKPSVLARSPAKLPVAW